MSAQERPVGDVHAAIDLGTNSFHLVVARAGHSGRFEVLTREKEMVRLGHGADDMKHLDQEAMERGIAALRRQREVAEAYGADISAVATSAVREAENRDEFLGRARDEAGVEIEVISGAEEARLIHLGVLQALPVFDRRILVVDIGGGSTELVVGEGREVLGLRSLKLGSIRLTDRFFPGGKVTDEALEECRSYVAAFIAPTVRELVGHGPVEVVASSGTAESVAALIAAEHGSGSLARFTLNDLDSVVSALAEAPNVKARRRIPGMDPKRADIIVAGAVVLRQVVLAFGLTDIGISEFALREGVLLDRWAERDPSSLHHLTDVRRSSVVHLARSLDPEFAHATAVADMALELYDGTATLHHLPAGSRELLEAAALLANVGSFISHSSHHKHSYYVIRNAESLAGFSEHERELIALVARYHRKSAPKLKHPEFAALNTNDQQLVRSLAGILRLAIGLDRRHAGSVADLLVAPDTTRGVVLTLVPAPGADLALELYAAGQRAALFEEVFDIPVEFEVAAAPTA
ncbi:MAG: Ppx/GppA family phosphatase [Actinomycetia bacterium]|nr:Ppx/GppA family phosphatase [Actinomycetes bacterium]